MLKSVVVQAKMEPNLKAALSVLASSTETNESAVLRLAARRYIEGEMGKLELRISAAEARGVVDADAHRRLIDLRRAYYGYG